jgi:bacterioferritin (cytochrome b1)
MEDTAMQANSNRDVKKLNEFLKNELAAVETYAQCIDRSSDVPTVQRLIELRQSHAHRAGLLKDRIVTLGGKPANSAGMWGGFARMVEGGAKTFGERAALSLLEEGEDKGLREYKKEVHDLTEPTRKFVSTSIIPEQQRSHDTLSLMTR